MRNSIFYEENKVKEYWLVHPELQTVETYVLANNKYSLNLRFENAEGVLSSPQFPDFNLNCKEIF